MMRAGLSPREMNGAALSLIVLSAATMSFDALDAGRIALRADQDEVVVHHRIALHAEAFGEEFLFRRLGVHEHHVGVAAPAGVERLAGALRHHLHVDAGLGLEQRQDVAEQAGILRRGGRGDDDRFVLREARRGECAARQRRAAGRSCAASSHADPSILVML